MHYEHEFSETALVFVSSALAQMRTPACRYYHNWEHVDRVYEWFHEWDYQLPLFLELAVLFHDVVYDQHPFKEDRSADFMKGQLAANPLASSRFRNRMTWEAHEKTVDTTAKTIMATSDHSLRNHDMYTWPMIRADLADLSDPVRTMENFLKIKEEAEALNGCSAEDFAMGNIAFMTGLRNRVSENRKGDLPEWREFWEKVEEGVAQTIDMSNRILNK